ncbi:hypothetical protein ATORI0001_1424 [Lancefieldella rimae ATCC 49626]|uniref:Uncharacterized protein n=1 Tax=Lancefieldella rimae (strain ATCC 49626 / DSM 7090 / CCUG 31168 / NBRC 15546 / VPI D140H-11A) TaxID=553184 RepID=B9CM85_LANR4|nr:hypothetical protein ATORI0001_1424 [Lancefieldella rimae ATCC 49626]
MQRKRLRCICVAKKTREMKFLNPQDADASNIGVLLLLQIKKFSLY